mgnify:CR=1 FL=1
MGRLSVAFRHFCARFHLMTPLEHIGIAVDDAEAVVEVYETLLGVLPYAAESVESQQVRTHFLAAGPAKLELLESLAPDSPIASHLERRGEGLHHLAFAVDDAAEAMERLRDAGFRLLSDEPLPGADDKEIFFIHPKDTHGVLIECCADGPLTWEPTRIPYRESHLALYHAGSDQNPPLLLLHGAAGSTRTETALLMKRLKLHFHILAVDFSGHGASDPIDEPFTADLFADNARAALDHFGYDSAHVFGFSMGGNMAMQLARRHPDRVRDVAVHGANVTWNNALMEAMLKRLDPATLPPSVAQHLASVHTDWVQLFADMQAFVRTLPEETPAMLDSVAELDLPVLVSAVDQDDLFPLTVPMTLHRRLPDARLAILPGTRHALPQAPLSRLATEVYKFFQRA